ncbi:uncharacterized protein N7529_007524 [Penicillium soppii]|uniref:uncharacterized protein n=1 Tax=Penicillium soppii TaxID=69789 RepID=UPI00254997F5|nr:uncharacterized protein N7529_007524 [Penicillium soppii]KAJ5860214.1 hypothetical protein N7529_007524 [Penicillium soppii]
MPPIRGKRDPELDCLTRAKICELNTTNGWEAKRQKQQSLPHSGALRKLTEEDRDHIYDTKQQTPPILVEDLLAQVDFKVKRMAIWRLTYEMGLRKWRKMQRPSLTPLHAEKRLHISTLHLQIRPAFIGPTNTQLNVESASGKNGRLHVRKTSFFSIQMKTPMFK